VSNGEVENFAHDGTFRRSRSLSATCDNTIFRNWTSRKCSKHVHGIILLLSLD